MGRFHERVTQPVFTLQQTLQRIEILFSKVHRPNRPSHTFRVMISLCNSVGIVLMQFDYLNKALEVLKKAVKTDILMYYEGRPQDLVWPQRALVYTNLGFLMLRRGDFPSSFKFLYDAESLLLEALETEDVAAKDIALAHNMTFALLMIALKRHREALAYMDKVTADYNEVANAQRPSQFVELGCLYCTITIALEVLKTKNPAIDCSLDEALTQFQLEQSAITTLMKRLADARGTREKFRLLDSNEYKAVVFLSCFLPLLAPDTPIISLKELCKGEEPGPRSAKEVRYASIMRQ